MRLQKSRGGMAFLAAVAVVAMGVFCSSSVQRLELTALGQPKLVSVQQLPETAEFCPPESADSNLIASMEQNPNTNLFAALRQEQRVALSGARSGSDDTPKTQEITRPAVRTIRDTYPIYSSVAVDPIRDEVILQDTNLFGVKIFSRLENTPRDVEAATPKRVIQGAHTHNEYNNGVHVDLKTGEISSDSMDTEDNMITFAGGASGDVAPLRILKTPHRNFALVADDEKGEVFISIQYPPKVVVYRREANGNEKPLRVLEGEHTQLYDAHGVALDLKRKLMFVGNWGNASDYRVAGSGKFYPPSINVYPLDANGDVAPLRIIQGSKTQLDWAGGMVLDPDTENIYVANDVGESVLVFKETDQGNVAPSAVIKGSKTGLSHPAGIAIDLMHKELWVSNMGNSSATCYSLNAKGNVAPVRTIRSAPVGRMSLKFGKPQGVTYDSKREQLLVSN
jgi:hypothetical protein